MASRVLSLCLNDDLADAVCLSVHVLRLAEVRVEILARPSELEAAVANEKAEDPLDALRRSHDVRLVVDDGVCWATAS